MKKPELIKKITRLITMRPSETHSWLAAYLNKREVRTTTGLLWTPGRISAFMSDNCIKHKTDAFNAAYVIAEKRLESMRLI